MASYKKGAIERGAILVFLDESGFSLKPSVRRTWAPRGQTPLLTHKFNWQRAHAIGAIACKPEGTQCELLLYVQEHAINKETIVAYLPALREHLGRSVVLLWDGLPSHRSKVVQQYLAANRDWLTVERFPGYAPELNPQEYVWSALKGKDLANFCPDETLELAERLQAGQERLGEDQQKMYGFLVASTLYEKRTDRPLT